jgi:hypothetical protein
MQQYSKQFLNGLEAKSRKVPVMKVVEECRDYIFSVYIFQCSIEKFGVFELELAGSEGNRGH